MWFGFHMYSSQFNPVSIQYCVKSMLIRVLLTHESPKIFIPWGFTTRVFLCIDLPNVFYTSVNSHIYWLVHPNNISRPSLAVRNIIMQFIFTSSMTSTFVSRITFVSILFSNTFKYFLSRTKAFEVWGSLKICSNSWPGCMHSLWIPLQLLKVRPTATSSERSQT